MVLPILTPEPPNLQFMQHQQSEKTIVTLGGDASQQSLPAVGAAAAGGPTLFLISAAIVIKAWKIVTISQALRIELFSADADLFHICGVLRGCF